MDCPDIWYVHRSSVDLAVEMIKFWAFFPSCEIKTLNKKMNLQELGAVPRTPAGALGARQLNVLAIINSARKNMSARRAARVADQPDGGDGKHQRLLENIICRYNVTEMSE